MSWNPKPTKAVDLKRDWNQSYSLKSLWGCWSLISDSFYTCFITLSAKKLLPTVLFTQWEIAILYPLVLLCLIPDPGEKQRGYGDLSSSTGPYPSHLDFFSVTVNFAQSSPLMTSKCQKSYKVLLLYDMQPLQNRKSNLATTPRLLCLSKNLNQDFTHSNVLELIRLIDLPFHSPEQPFHSTSSSPSFKISNTSSYLI